MSQISEQNVPAVTPRAVVFGAILVALANITSIYAHYILRGSDWACDYFPLSVGFPFLALLLLNVALRLLERPLGGRYRLAFTGPEIIVILIMILVGSTLPTFGLVGFFLANASAPHFYADEANQWARYLLPHTNDWMVVRDPEAVRQFYNGLPEGARIPWGAWAVPLFWWTTFFAALFSTCFFTIAILRKQWVEEERLSFPIAEVSAEMVDGLDEPGRMAPNILRSKLFWMGMAVPVVFGTLQIVSFFYPGAPVVSLVITPVMPAGYPPLWLWIIWPVIGFAFFGRLEILLSVWFFYLVFYAQGVIFNRIGYITAPPEGYCSRYSFSGNQSFGALVVLVAVNLFLSRRHLKNVVCQALWPSHYPGADSDELVSSRTAFFGLLLSLAYVSLWLYKAGMEPHVIAIFLPLAFIIFLGITRGVVEGGLIWLRGPVIAQPMTLSILGSSALSGRSIMSLYMTYLWHGDIKAFFMPAAAHSAKLADLLRINKRRIAWVVALAAFVAYGASVWYTLTQCYKTGAYSFQIHMFTNGAVWPFTDAKRMFTNRESYRTLLTKYEVAEARTKFLQERQKGLSAQEALDGLKREEEGVRENPRWRETFAKLNDLDGLSQSLSLAERAAPESPEKKQAQDKFAAAVADIELWPKKFFTDYSEARLARFLKTLSPDSISRREERDRIEKAILAASEGIKDRDRFWKAQKELEIIRVKRETLEAAAASGRTVGQELAESKAEQDKDQKQIPPSRDWTGIFFMGVGALAAAFLFIMRFMFSWWPLHPLGLAFAMVLPIELSFLSIFIAWLAKTIVIRSGGIKLYNVVKFFFIGLIFGQMFISGIGFIVDLIFFNEPRGGHSMYGW